MSMIKYAVLIAFFIVLNACAGQVEQTCTSKGYVKGSTEFQNCFAAKRCQNDYVSTGIGGGGT